MNSGHKGPKKMLPCYIQYVISGVTVNMSDILFIKK